MNPLFAPLIISPRLRRILLRVSLVTFAMGVLLLFGGWVLLRLHGPFPQSGPLIIVPIMITLLMIVVSPAGVLVWAIATVQAKYYGVAAEDARDLAADLEILPPRRGAPDKQRIG